jgi:hypothetical protein
MASIADLHSHSTISDGRLTPTQLIDLAYRNGVRIMSLTDHDIVDGLPEAFEAAARYDDFTLIQHRDEHGRAEAGASGSLHRLAQRSSAEAHICRSPHGPRAQDGGKLATLGKPVDWERSRSPKVPWYAAHRARARRSRARLISERAFELYISRTGPLR